MVRRPRARLHGGGGGSHRDAASARRRGSPHPILRRVRDTGRWRELAEQIEIYELDEPLLLRVHDPQPAHALGGRAMKSPNPTGVRPTRIVDVTRLVAGSITLTESAPALMTYTASP